MFSTYRPSELVTKFIRQDDSFNLLTNSDFNKFFVIREEDLVKLVKPPIPPMRATSNLLIYISVGVVQMNLGVAKYQVCKNECLIVPAGQVFSMATSDNDDVKGYLCSFSNDIAVGKIFTTDPLKNFEFLKLWGQHLIKLNTETSGFIGQLFDRLMADYYKHGQENVSIIQSYLLALLCELNQQYEPQKNIKNNQYLHITNRFKELLFSEDKGKCLISDYASFLGITPNHLNKALKHTTGKSTSNWIEEMLVMEAKILLSQTNLTISEIAAEVGIYDAGYFGRLFKKQEKMTPTDYRKMIEKS